MTLYATSTGTLVLALGAQFIAFVVLARHLGTTQFGYMVTISAATELACALCGVGAGEALIRRVVRDPSLYPAVLGHNLILMLSSGVVLTLVTTVGLAYFVPVDPDPVANAGVMFLFALGGIPLSRWIGVTEQIFLGHRQFGRANALNAGFAVWRSVVTLFACFVFNVDHIHTWVFWYVGMYAVGVIACWAAVRRYGAPRWTILREELKLGFHFSTPFFFNMLRQNVDLLSLNLVAAPATIGKYSAASRIVLTSMVTVHSFNRLLYPKLAVAGKDGVRATLGLAIKYVILAVGLAVVTSAAVFVIAPFMPWLFGRDFGDMVTYMRVLCWVPILISFTNAAYDSLGAADRHGVRAMVYNIGCVAASALIFVSTYFFGIDGTFVAVYVSHGLIAIAMWITVFRLGRDPADV
ncbi:MAG TPA: lipopolysaccharide biosynthesis protein [Xanthobacteraceae bacterium]|nr:lipopolysaccharide biosynthesis protein [Xanthobacteraceae bacterium]